MPSTTASSRVVDSVETRVRIAVQAFATNLERGQSAELVRFLTAMSRFHRYSFWNYILIQEQRPDATRVAGRQTWKTLKRRIIDRSRGIEIRVPNLPNWALRLPPADKRDMFFTGFHDGKVYDLSDTDGEPLPTFPLAAGDPAPYLDALKQMITDIGIELRYASHTGKARAESYGRWIGVRRGQTPEEELEALVGAAARAMLFERERRCPKLKSVTQAEAQAAAFIVRSVAGFDMTAAANEVGELYNGDTEVLRGSLGRIQRIARCIIRGMRVDTPV